MKKDPNFGHTYHCKVTLKQKQFGQPIEEIKADGAGQIKYSISTKKVQVPQWAFKVFPQDGNYNQRHDKVNDYFEFDPDQNWQIERHYQDCVSGYKRFGEQHIIIGDFNAQKNGWRYAVWGSSADIQTWKEQNVTLKNTVVRQLNRTLVEKDEMVVLEEREKSQELEQRMRGGVVPDEEEKKGDVAQEEYLISGLTEDVQALIAEINNQA